MLCKRLVTADLFSPCSPVQSSSAQFSSLHFGTIILTVPLSKCGWCEQSHSNLPRLFVTLQLRYLSCWSQTKRWSKILQCIDWSEKISNQNRLIICPLMEEFTTHFFSSSPLFSLCTCCNKQQHIEKTEPKMSEKGVRWARERREEKLGWMWAMQRKRFANQEKFCLLFSHSWKTKGD